jgi:hypothetical protein
MAIVASAPHTDESFAMHGCEYAQTEVEATRKSDDAWSLQCQKL